MANANRAIYGASAGALRVKASEPPQASAMRARSPIDGPFLAHPLSRLEMQICVTPSRRASSLWDKPASSLVFLINRDATRAARCSMTAARIFGFAITEEDTSSNVSSGLSSCSITVIATFVTFVIRRIKKCTCRASSPDQVLPASATEHRSCTLPVMILNLLALSGS